MARSQQDGVRMWFWARNDPNVPSVVAYPSTTGLFGPPTITPEPWWGEPVAAFPMGPDCDYESHFNAHNFVFDLTFCVSHGATTVVGC